MMVQGDSRSISTLNMTTMEGAGKIGGLLGEMRYAPALALSQYHWRISSPMANRSRLGLLLVARGLTLGCQEPTLAIPLSSKSKPAARQTEKLGRLALNQEMGCDAPGGTKS